MVNLVISRTVRAALLVFFAYGVFHFAMIQLQWAPRITDTKNYNFLIALIILVALFALMPKKLWNDKSDRWHFWLWAILLILFTPFLLLKYLMGVNDIGTIIIFLNGTSIADATNVGLADFTGAIIKEITFVIAILIAGFILFRTTRYFNIVLIMTAMFLAIKHPVTEYAINLIVPNPAHKLVSLERDFHPPQITSEPEKPKNLILIYLESLERTYFDIPEAQGAVKGMIKLAGTGVEATNVVQVYGSHNTIAGMVSTQCGAPLLPSSRGNTLRQLTPIKSGFMETVTCLGDVLSEKGYALSFIKGADMNTYSARAFLKTHGYDRLFDVFSYSAESLDGHLNSWGFDDAFLFDRAIEELEYLAKGDKPFVLSLLTITTHGPDGFPDEGCQFDSGSDAELPRAIYCSIKGLNRFLDRVKASGLGENTVIAVMSDHLAPPNSFQTQLRERVRRNYMVYLNTGAPAKINKLATPFDAYPTLMEMLGYELSERRANFGVSLLSPQPSLINLFGEKLADQVFKGNSQISEPLWRMDGEEKP